MREYRVLYRLRVNIYLGVIKSKDFVDNLSLIENKEAKKESLCFNWQDSLPIQHLLDIISSILVEEYIAIAKQNQAVFSEIASPLSGVRNDKL